MTGRLPGVAVAWEPGKLLMQFDGSAAAKLEISFAGASQAVPHGSSLETSQSNYLLGSDPNRWRTHVPNYRQVVYSSLYPGIDGVFYGNGKSLEHDFVISPGADYRQIRLHLSSRASVSLESNGDMTIALPEGKLSMHKPVIYQDLSGRRQRRKGGFRLLANGDVSFAVGSYDHRLPLVIDPVLSFSTYLTSQFDNGGFIATDSNGNNYLTGVVTLGFPQTPGAFPGCGTCVADEIVANISKLSPDGKTLIYSTLIGGNGYTQSFAIAADANGNALVAGRTEATDFPTKNGQAVGQASAGFDFGFLISLSADGSALNYGTLLGGSAASGPSEQTLVSALVVDAAGNAYVSGDTGSSFYPYTPGALNNGAPAFQASQIFLSEFNPAGNLLYSALLGDPDPQPNSGAGGPTGANALALDTDSNVYVTGVAGSLWPTTAGAYLQQNSGTQPFVAKVAAGGASFVYSTLLPTATPTGIAAPGDGSAFVAGYGAPATYPTTANAYQPTSTALNNSFLTELNPSGSALTYSTFFGDSTYYLNALALDADGDLWLAGRTQGSQFPLATPLEAVLPLDALFLSASTLSQFDPTGTVLKFSTFLGGIANGSATGLAVDANHRAHVTGSAGAGLYTTSGVYLGSLPAGPAFEAVVPFVALVDPNVAAPAVCINPNAGLYWNSVTVGTFVDLPLTVSNCGTLPLTLAGVLPAAGVFTVPAAENGCTQSIPEGQSCTLRIRYSPTAAETDNSTLTLRSNASMTQTVTSLSAMGVVPVILVPAPPTFGLTLLGQTSSPAQLVIENAGGSTLLLNAANTRTSGDFSLQGLAGCSTIAAFQACSLPIYFTPTAPGSRTGTLEIASNDLVNPTVSVPLQATGYATAPVPQITSVGSQLLASGVVQTRFPVQGFGFVPSSVVELNGIPQTTTYAGENELIATLAASSIPANSYGEIALTVVTPSPGGGQSAPVTLTQYQSLPYQNAFLLYEPVGKQLYASIPAASTTNPNTVIAINPVTAAAGTPIPVGNDPGVLAVSSDGAYLYVALNADHSIQRINLSTLAIERTFPLPVDPEFGALQVFDMHAVPGASTEVVVSLDQPQVDPAANGVALFNDAGLVNWIPRGGSNPNYNQLSSDIYKFAFTDPSTVYGISAYQGILNQLTVSPSGIAATTNTCCMPSSDSVASDGTSIYTGGGLVWNPSTGQQLASYPIGTLQDLDSVLPDLSTGKTYFLVTFQPLSILAFDQASLAATGSVTLGNFGQESVPSATQLVRWGANGFAFRTSVPPQPADGTTNGLVLFTSSITQASNLIGTPVVTALAPGSVPAGGSDFIITVTGSGFVPGSTAEWNNTQRPTTIVSPTQLTANIYASDIAVMGTAQITVVNPGNGGGVSGPLPFTISVAGPPAAPVVTVSPANLTFAAQVVSTASAAQTIALTNSGNADLTGLNIALAGANAGSFAQTNNCGTTVSAGASCMLNVVFTPAGPGSLAATVTITNNAASSPQSVALSGTGASTTFTIAPQPGAPATATVTSGGPATYSLALSPAAGYSGTVALSCEALPTNASCSFTPTKLALVGGTSASFSLTVATQATQTSSLQTWNTFLGGALLLFSLPRRNRRRWLAGTVPMALLFLVSTLSGCGGTGGTSAPTQAITSSPATVTPGTYTIQVVASDGATTQKMALTLIVKN